MPKHLLLPQEDTPADTRVLHTHTQKQRRNANSLQKSISKNNILETQACLRQVLTKEGVEKVGNNTKYVSFKGFAKSFD